MRWRPRRALRSEGRGRSCRNCCTRSNHAVALLLAAVEITPDVARARRPTRPGRRIHALDIADSDLALRAAEQALAARRELGDDAEILNATSNLGRVLNLGRGDLKAAYELAKAAMAEFPDLLETPDGVRLTLAASGLAGILGNDVDRLAASDKTMPLAERLDDPDLIIGALINRSLALMNMGRASEGSVVLRGAHEMAMAYGLREPEVRGRVLRNFLEQWGDPALGVQLTLDGLDLAKSYGSERLLDLARG